MKSKITENIDWLGHASFRIRGEKIVYIDPWKIKGSPRDGDLVLITHSHYDHLSFEDVIRVAKSDATIVIPVADSDKIDWSPVIQLGPECSSEVRGVQVKTVRAYNLDKDFHPRSQDWVGYIVTLLVDGQPLRIYHAGDTDCIPEMKDVECDIAFLPVSGTYVMTAEEAVEAVKIIKPHIAIPMHYGDIVGQVSDAERFMKKAECKVVLKEPESCI